MNASKRLAIKQAIQDRLILEENDRIQARREWSLQVWPEQEYGGDGPWNNGGDDYGHEEAGYITGPTVTVQEYLDRAAARADETDCIPF